MAQALYRKWRPKLWDEVIGQEHIVQTLRNAIQAGRVGHAYLFAGPRGTGKTTTARLLAKAVNCLDQDAGSRPCNQCEHCLAVNANKFLDLIEIDAASNTSVEDVRDLRDKINFSPTQGKYKIYIIDEVHMLSTAAFNALLKTLEEPPPHAIFILATTEIHKIPATVLSRCQRHEFRRIPVEQISAELKRLCQQESLQVEDAALTLIARQATGSMRDAISLLDQLTSTGQAVDLDTAQAVLGTAASQTVVELVNALLDRQPGSGMGCIHQALDSGADARQFARQVVDYLRGLLLVQTGNAAQVDTTGEQREVMKIQAERFPSARLVEALRLFNNAASEVRSGWQPGLQLEMAVAEFCGQSIEAAAEQPAVRAVRPPAQTANTKPEAAVRMEAPPGPEKEPLAEKPADKFDSAVQPAAAKPGPANSAVGFGLHEIQSAWPQVRALVKKQRSQTEALLNSVRKMDVKDNTLILGFASEVLKSKMESGDHLEVTRQALVRVTGKDIPVTCAVTHGGGPLTLEQEAESDGMVNAALNLGGKIVHKD